MKPWALTPHKRLWTVLSAVPPSGGSQVIEHGLGLVRGLGLGLNRGLVGHVGALFQDDLALRSLGLTST